MKKYGLIFDVDGVIADTEPFNHRASIKVFEDMFGVTGVRPEDFEAGIGRGAAEYVKAAAAVHDIEMTDQQVAQATQMRQDNFFHLLKTEKLPPFPGVLELMRQAIEAEVFEVAIATSGTKEKSTASLEAVGAPYTEVVFINGSMVTKKKPNPQLFLLAIEAMGLDASRCCVIEDAPNGIEAAKAAGAKCIAVTNSTTPDKLEQADLICNSMTEINLNNIKDLIDSE